MSALASVAVVQINSGPMAATLRGADDAWRGFSMPRPEGRLPPGHQERSFKSTDTPEFRQQLSARTSGPTYYLLSELSPADRETVNRPQSAQATIGGRTIQ